MWFRLRGLVLDVGGRVLMWAKRRQPNSKMLPIHMVHRLVLGLECRGEGAGSHPEVQPAAEMRRRAAGVNGREGVPAARKDDIPLSTPVIPQPPA